MIKWSRELNTFTIVILFIVISNLITFALGWIRQAIKFSFSISDWQKDTFREMESTFHTRKERTWLVLPGTPLLTPIWASNKVILELFSSLPWRHVKHRLRMHVFPERNASMARPESQQQERQIRKNQREETYNFNLSLMQRVSSWIYKVLEHLPKLKIRLTTKLFSNENHIQVTFQQKRIQIWLSIWLGDPCLKKVKTWQEVRKE